MTLKFLSWNMESTLIFFKNITENTLTTTVNEFIIYELVKLTMLQTTGPVTLAENVPSRSLVTKAVTKLYMYTVSSFLPFCICLLIAYAAGLGGSVGYAVRLETRRSRVQPLPRSATFFRGDWSWNIFYGHSLPSADSRRAVVSFWRKDVHNTG